MNQAKKESLVDMIFVAVVLATLLLIKELEWLNEKDFTVIASVFQLILVVMLVKNLHRWYKSIKTKEK